MCHGIVNIHVLYERFSLSVTVSKLAHYRIRKIAKSTGSFLNKMTQGPTVPKF